MNFDIVAGTLVTIGALLTVIILYVWSARIIETVHRSRHMSLRQIKEELRNGPGAD